MRILIVGAGALGGYFGARLLAGGRDVTFLVRPRSAALLAANGLNVLSSSGDLALPPPPTLLAENLRDSFDLILLSCKAPDLDSAINDFAPAAGPRTVILPILNGMAHMEALDRRFGRGHVLGGSSHISAVRDAQGRILHLNRLDALLLGDRYDPAGERIQQVHRALSVPGFDALLRPHILQDLWQKWIGIATAAGITCLMRASIGDIVAVRAAGLVRQLFGECASIATREGFPPAPWYVESTLAKFTEPGSSFTASMLRDLEAGAPIESQQIVGDLLDHGRRLALPTPLLEVVHFHLRCHEERQKRESHASDAARASST